MPAAAVDRIAPDLLGLAVPLDKLRPLPGNPRRGDVEAVARSYGAFGQRKPIVARRDGTVIAGNHQLAAARKLGWPDIAVVWVDDDDATANAFALADNRTADLGSYDSSDLLAMLEGVRAADAALFAATSYGDDDLAELLAWSAKSVGDTAPIAPPKNPVSKVGDLFVLGQHRLLCGDATSPENASRLLGGEEPALVVTDPPYGVDYQGPLAGSASRKDAYAARRRQDGLVVGNDTLGAEGTRALVAAAFRVCGLRPGGVFYVCAPPGDMEMAFRLGLLDAGLPMRHSIVWVKDQFTFGRSDYHYRHESILHGWREGAAHYFVADRTQDSVWEIPRPRVSKEHPTMKPVELFERAIANSSRASWSVLDPFAGSGTALIACENLGRRCYAMELDPQYVDVCVDRWERHTGKSAVRG